MGNFLPHEDGDGDALPNGEFPVDIWTHSCSPMHSCSPQSRRRERTEADDERGRRFVEAHAVKETGPPRSTPTMWRRAVDGARGHEAA